MSETVTLEIPDALARQARQVAASTHRRLEEVLVEWIDRIATEVPIEVLPDDQVLALSDLQMDNSENEELSDLLSRQREGLIDQTDQHRLDQLLNIYRRGMVNKARALRVAVERGLRPPLN
jgi:hypothetical protein